MVFQPQPAGADQLRAGFDLLAAPTSTTVTVDITPLDVGAYRDGFSLTMSRKGNGEAGIYVVPKYMEVAPNPGRLAHFERISDGIYWYTFEP